MSQLGIVVDLPEVGSLTAANFIDIANDVVRQVRNQYPAEAPSDNTATGTFSTTTTDADPGAGNIRLNAADQRSATKLYIPDDLDATRDWAAITARLGAVTGDVKGWVRIQATAAPENFVVFEVTSTTDATGYTKLNGTVKTYGRLSTGTSPTVIVANSTAVKVTVSFKNTTRASATFDAVAVGAQLTALTDAEIAAQVATGVLTALGDVEFATIAGGSAGELTGVTGLAADDVLVAVYKVTEANPPTVTDLTSEFTITAAETIDNTSGTATTGESVLVLWYTPI